MKKIIFGVVAVVVLSLGVAAPTWAIRPVPEDVEAAKAAEEAEKEAQEAIQAATRTVLCNDSTVSDEDKTAAGCDLTLCDDPKIDQALKDAAGCPASAEERNNTIFSAITTLIQVVLTLFGIIAVGVIIYGAITYVTSTGEAAKIAKAKNIILYGLVGLIVASLAFALVNFVSASIGSAV